MRDPRLLKRWKVSEALLRRAHGALPGLPQNQKFCSLEATFFEYIEHNEHGLALDVLEELGELAFPRGGFWKDLIRAAENMELTDRIPRFQKKFHEALLALSRPR
jgi:hypothetical protein